MSRSYKKLAVYLGACSVVALTSGCSVPPTVQYTHLSKTVGAPDDAFDSYYLQASKIRIELADAKQTFDKRYKVTSLPIESDRKLALSHRDPFWMDSTVNIAKRENTDLPAETDTKATNNGATMVTKAGEAAVALLPFITALAENLEAPVSISAAVEPGALPAEFPMATYLGKVGPGEGSQYVVKDAIAIDIGPVPPDAVAFGSFPQTDRRYLYSACRTVQVRFGVLDDKTVREVSTTVKVADPNFLQKIAYPEDGKLVMHSECGVSYTSNGSPNAVSTGSDIVKALATQGKAIADAIEASKKAGK